MKAVLDLPEQHTNVLAYEKMGRVQKAELIREALRKEST
jgi:hypothetical protein